MKRCVTRNADLKRGTRNVVGRVMTVKSGCARFKSLSGSAWSSVATLVSAASSFVESAGTGFFGSAASAIALHASAVASTNTDNNVFVTFAPNCWAPRAQSIGG